MKTSTAVILIAVITCCNIEVDAFSFNFSGAINPGFTFGVKSHSRQWKYQLKNNRYEVSDWLQPGHVSKYNVPEYVSKPIVSGAGSDNTEKLHTQNYGSNHRNRRY